MLTLTNLVLAVLVVGWATVAVYCKRSLLRQSRGLEVHGHADGTVHEHHRGAAPHDHPTVSERYEDRLSRMLRERRTPAS